MATKRTAPSFCDLPVEIRGQIIGELFFPNEPYPKTNNVNGCWTQKQPAVRSISVFKAFYDDEQSYFQTSIIRTCKQLQYEAEEVLYGTSSWKITAHPRPYRNDSSETRKRLEALPQRLRGLIRRVEIYHMYDKAMLTNFECSVLMTFLARKFPSLQSLRLCARQSRRKLWLSDLVASVNFLKSYEKDMGQALGTQTSTAQATSRLDTDGLLLWLHAHFVDSTMPNPVLQQSSQDSKESTFHFLGLPRLVRDRIYRHTIIPPNHLIHPYIKPYFDGTTLNVIPLFLANKQIHQEAEGLLCKDAVFHSATPQYDERLQQFVEALYTRHNRQKAFSTRQAVIYSYQDGMSRKWSL